MHLRPTASKQFHDSIDAYKTNRYYTDPKSHIIKPARWRYIRDSVFDIDTSKNHEKQHNRPYDAAKQDHRHRKIDEEIGRSPGEANNPRQNRNHFLPAGNVVEVDPAELSENIGVNSCPGCERSKETRIQNKKCSDQVCNPDAFTE